LAGYLEFGASEDAVILVEVSEAELSPESGLVKAGLRQTAQDVI